MANEERPRLVSALDGMRIRKIAAGGITDFWADFVVILQLITSCYSVNHTFF